MVTSDWTVPRWTGSQDRGGIWRRGCERSINTEAAAARNTCTEPTDESQASNDKQIRSGLHGDGTCRCVRCPFPDIKAVVASRLNYITHLHGSARAPFSLGQAGAVGQKIHFMSSVLYTESRC